MGVETFFRRVNGRLVFKHDSDYSGRSVRNNHDIAIAFEEAKIALLEVSDYIIRRPIYTGVVRGELKETNEIHVAGTNLYFPLSTVYNSLQNDAEHVYSGKKTAFDSNRTDIGPAKRSSSLITITRMKMLEESLPHL